MVGKRVCHLSSDERGNTQWFNGTVTCNKPGTVSEMVIRFDGYPTLYSFDFSEFSEKLLKLIPLDPEFIVGLFILHKFCDEDELDEWCENGKIISYNPALYTINYFDVDEQGALTVDEDEEDLSVYETLVREKKHEFIIPAPVINSRRMHIMFYFLISFYPPFGYETCQMPPPASHLLAFSDDKLMCFFSQA